MDDILSIVVFMITKEFPEANYWSNVSSMRRIDIERHAFIILMVA